MSNGKNVWVADKNYEMVKQYDMEASVNSKEFEYQKYRNIYRGYEQTENSELLKKKEDYFALSLKLSNTSNFFAQSKITPDCIWIEDTNSKLPVDSEPMFFIDNGGFLFRKACADILQQFKMGENLLTPVQIYALSTGGRVTDEVFYFLNIYERHEYVTEEQPDSSLSRVPIAKDKFGFSGQFFRDDQYQLSKLALDCSVDLWHDPKLLRSIFMSNDLYQAMKQAGFDKYWDMHTCKLV